MMKIGKIYPCYPCEIDQLVAQHVFGWRWVAFKGRPTHGHPEYHTFDESTFYVREFFSPEQLKNARWKKYFTERDARSATGDEPLSYAYCSSRGVSVPPNYAEDDDALVLEHVRTKWKGKKLDAFAALLPRAERYKPGDYSKAALKVLGVLP